nr:acylneuraminate cytidylyltransferase family protein [Vibrio pectenicida]
MAIVPARGGSKRLPRKNILEIAGKPLISYTLEAALESKYIDQVLVSSDSNEILDKVSKYESIVAHKRPSHLATDVSSSIDCVINVLEQYPDVDYVAFLQPTSPLRTHSHIDEAIELLEKKNALSVISVCECEHSPLWCNTLDSSNLMETFIRKEAVGLRSQDLEPYYRLNGAIYITSKSCLIEQKSFFLDEHTYAYRMTREASVDIDNNVDFMFAKFLIESSQSLKV